MYQEHIVDNHTEHKGATIFFEEWYNKKLCILYSHKYLDSVSILRNIFCAINCTEKASHFYIASSSALVKVFVANDTQSQKELSEIVTRL